MITYNNAGRWNGRRVEDEIRVCNLDYIDLDAIAVGYWDRDPATIRGLVEHLCDVSPEHHLETLKWLLEHGERLGGDA